MVGDKSLKIWPLAVAASDLLSYNVVNRESLDAPFICSVDGISPLISFFHIQEYMLILCIFWITI